MPEKIDRPSDDDAGAASAAASLGGIFATGRSGSTWLGGLVNSHPRVAYRFEPFHRLAGRAALDKSLELLRSQDLVDADLETVYRSLLPAHPRVEVNPFFPKRMRRNRGIDLAYRAARVRLFPSAIFRSLYSPQGRPFIVFKEVTMEREMRNLLERTSVPVVYLVRHPVAVCHSEHLAQQANKMPTWRQSHLPEVLERRPDLLEFVEPRLDELTMLERNAVLWRLDVETGLDAALGASRCMLVAYEQLCADPMAGVETVFGHLGLDVPAETRDFVLALQSGESSDQMFSIFKNPADVVDRWRTHVPADAQRQVMEIVGDSPALDRFAKWW